MRPSGSYGTRRPGTAAKKRPTTSTSTRSPRPGTAKTAKSSASRKKKQRSDKDIILMLHNYFHKNGKSNVGGFHFMDKDGNGEIESSEIVRTLKDGGISISNTRAKELIAPYVTENGVMDIPGYIRFMASAYTYEDDTKAS